MLAAPQHAERRDRINRLLAGWVGDLQRHTRKRADLGRGWGDECRGCFHPAYQHIWTQSDILYKPLSFNYSKANRR